MFTEEIELITDSILDFIHYFFDIYERSSVQSETFRKESYQIWALRECIKRVFSNPDQNPLTSLFEFAHQLEKYSYDDTDCIFSSASEIVDSLIFNLYGLYCDYPTEIFYK